MKKQKYFILSLLLGLVLLKNTFAQLPTAQEIAAKMKIGWNMGNTLEAICGETVWGGAYTTQKLIDSVKAAGFNAIRLPCAWFCHSDTTKITIYNSWLTRVKQVVDMCMKDSVYTILNIHWDSGWLENRVNSANQTTVNKRQKAYWTQIANYFKDYDEHLIFASANEPNVSDAAGMTILLSYHQTFIDAVRATGGNNKTRTLIIQGPSTDIAKTNSLMNKMPTDSTENRLMVEIHYYTPWNFCGMTKDETWGNMFYYWGKPNHSTTDTGHNPTWGEESDVDYYFGIMKTKFVAKGIPVIVGEYGAIKRSLSNTTNQALHLASLEYYFKYVTKSALQKGLIPFCWDVNNELFTRSTGATYDKGRLTAIQQGYAEATATSITKIDDTQIIVYPNPFTSTINLSIDKIDDIYNIQIFTILGKEVETIEHSALSNLINFGSKLESNVYIVRINGKSWTKSIKIVKN